MADDELFDRYHIAERPGKVIGSYQLLEQIGDGGFGVVYMAEQTHPVKRKVALKVIKPGMDSKEVIAPLRGRTPSSGDDEPPQHCQDFRRWRHGKRSAVLRDGVG